MSEMMSVETTETVREILSEILQRDDIAEWPLETALLGAVAEFDSMAVVTVLTQLEDALGLVIDDDEISAEVFASLGSLVRFVSEKTA